VNRKKALTNLLDRGVVLLAEAERQPSDSSYYPTRPDCSHDHGYLVPCTNISPTRHRPAAVKRLSCPGMGGIMRDVDDEGQRTHPRAAMASQEQKLPKVGGRTSLPHASSIMPPLNPDDARTGNWDPRADAEPSALLFYY
jgi:hypothetical protein